MTIRRVARALVIVLDVVVLAASGIYLIVYLYRWEWNRAVVSGVFFLIAEIAMVTMLLLGRLARIEQRMASGDGRGSAIPADAWRADRERPFAWLGDGQAVFVPVLIGVGAILSAVAYVIEHLASATAPTERPPTDTRLGALDAPAGPLVPTGGGVGADDDLGPYLRAPTTTRVASGVVASLVGALLLVTTVNLIAGATKNRPDKETEGAASAVELLVSVRDEDVSARQVADALWVSCRVNLPHEAVASLEWVRGPLVRMRIEPAVGHNAERRFVGCLHDLTVEGALARVTDWQTLTAPASA